MIHFTKPKNLHTTEHKNKEIAKDKIALLHGNAVQIANYNWQDVKKYFYFS